MRRKNIFINIAVLLVLLSSFAFTPGRAAAAYCDAAQFVADVTIPDGTVFAPGTTFTKTWRLKNVGTCTWTTSYALVFDKGEQMGAPAVVQLTSSIAPGQTVDLTVDMTAPSKNGKLIGYWRLRNANGVLFGIGSKANASFWVEINVVEPKNVVLDFVATAGDAKWSSGAGNLTFPGTEGDANGFAVKKDKPKRENGQENSEAGLVVGPQNVTNGYVRGEYPAFRVEKGDRFQSLVHCEYNASSCYVNFRLDYQIGSGAVKTFWAFREKYEGLYYNANLDLSSLAGQDVKFFLRVDAYGSPTGDRAVWGGSKIVRGVGTGPTVTPSATPTGPTPTPTNTPAPGACTNKVQFIADVNVPDGTVMTPGKAFKKTWRLKNIGTCTWTTSYSLIFDSGEQMGGPASVALTSQVKPGQSVDLSVDLTAPNANGTYRGNWKLANEGGTRFGLGTNADKPWWVEIKVSGGPTATPSATPTGPTPTPSNTPTPTATTDPNACTNKVKFIADVNVPDGTVITAGKTFTKTWRVQNAGTCTWTTKYALVFESGDQMNGAGSATLSAQVKPGQTVDLSIALTAPSANGTYRGNWMLANESGAHFGLGTNADKPWWVEIKVTGGTSWKTYKDSANTFQFNYPPEGQLGGSRIGLPFVEGTNLVEKWLEVSVKENVSACESALGGVTEPEPVTFNGINFVKQTGGDGGAGQFHEWVSYSAERGDICVTMDFVLHSTNPGAYQTPPPEFDKSAESAVFTSIMETFAWLISGDTGM